MDLADFDRPLNPRGLRAAPFMGRYIAEHGYLPDAIINYLLLLGFAILVERSFRVSPQRPRPSVLTHGFFPAVAYVIGAVSYVLWLEAHP